MLKRTCNTKTFYAKKELIPLDRPNANIKVLAAAAAAQPYLSDYTGNYQDC